MEARMRVINKIKHDGWSYATIIMTAEQAAVVERNFYISHCNSGWSVDGVTAHGIKIKTYNAELASDPCVVAENIAHQLGAYHAVRAVAPDLAESAAFTPHLLTIEERQEAFYDQQ